MNIETTKFLMTWALALFLGMMVFQFLHECGHGFGSQLDGMHVSTGFSRVGDPYKCPSDPDFRSDTMVTGILGSGGLLGPFTNWMFAIFFTTWLLHRKTVDRMTLLIGAGAVTNALMRLIAMSLFFFGALLGRIHLEDEVLWGIRAVQELNLPMPFADFITLIKMQPELFLSEPRIYFWPLVSFGIVLFCFILAYRHLYAIFEVQLSCKLVRWIFGLMPIVVIPPMFLLCLWLDNLVRINW
jgi:hypothetical protein